MQRCEIEGTTNPNKEIGEMSIYVILFPSVDLGKPSYNYKATKN